MTDRYLGMDFMDLSFVEEQKLKRFFHKFTEEYYQEYKIGHIIFAAYAAVPIYINPDLLYKIWMNFNEYCWNNNAEKIHLVAVVDLINASFCEEIGPKLYRINEGVRKTLNEWLRNENIENTKKIFSENDIAHFINAELKHYQKDYNLWGGAEYVFDQGLNADLLVYPERAMDKIKQVLNKAETDTEKLLAFNLLVDAKKKISTEIDFDDLAELGKGWKEYLLGKPTKLLKKLENLESSFLKDEPSSQHSMEITIPTEIVKEEIAQKKKKRIYGIFVGIDEYADDSISNLNNCAKDAKLLHGLLKENIDKEKNKIDFKLLVNEQVIINRIDNCLDELKELDDGDTFIFYYSGYIQNTFGVKLGRDFTFHNSVFIDTKDGGHYDVSLTQSAVEQDIYKTIKEKNIHCVLIFDCSDVTEDGKSFLYDNDLRKGSDINGSAIILEGVNSKIYQSYGRFGDILVNVFKSGGLHTSYHEIHEKIRLNILQQNASSKKEYIPKIEAFPSDAIYLKFLNNTENLYDNLEIYYSKDRSQWEVNAGFNKGINSSNPWIPTILEAEIDNEKIKWQIDKSYLNYASLVDFKGNENRKIKARLLQNSFKKILFFIDDKESFNEKMRHELSGYLEKRDVPLVEITKIKLEAKYIISHNNILGYFVYDPLFGETLSIIELQDNLANFITHLEYLAHWEGLLQYSNINSKLKPNDLSWALSLNNGLITQRFFNLMNIDIHVKKDYGSKTMTEQAYNEPSENSELECTVTYKGQSSGEILKETFYLANNDRLKPEINFELISGFEEADFGISMLILEDNLSIEEMPTTYIYKGNSAIRRINYDYVNTVRSKLRKNKQLYLKIFLSHKKINTQSLLQEGTNKDFRNKNDLIKELGEFDASETDWISYTIPINVTLVEGSNLDEPIYKNFKNTKSLKVERQKVLFFTITTTGNSLVETESNFTEIHSIFNFDFENFITAVNNGANPAALQGALMDENPKILHLFVEGNKEGIQLKKLNGEFVKVPELVLTNLFSLFEGIIDCVILDGCYEARQAEAIVNHVPFVIGITNEANQLGVQSFNTHFYKFIGSNNFDIMLAYKKGSDAAQEYLTTGEIVLLM